MVFGGGGGEGFNLGTAFGRIVIDGSSIDSSIQNVSKSISGGLQSIGSSLTGVGLSLTALGAPFLAFGAKALGAFEESQASLHQLDAVLKSTGGSAGVTRDAAIDLSKELQKLTTYSDEAVLNGENLLLTFTNIGKDIFPDATRAILDMSTALGQDVKSSAIQLGKALQDPILGITALRRVGVNFNDAQKEIVKQMVKSGDLMGAQKYILRELKTEFGDSALAAGQTFGGQLAILRNRFDDLLESIGERIIPVLQSLMGFVDQLITGFENLDPATQQTIINIGLLLAGLAVVGPVIAAVGVALSAIGGVLAFLLSSLGLVIAGIAALALAFETNFGGIRDFLQPIITWFQQTFGDVWGALTAGVPILNIISVLLYRLLPPEVAAQITQALMDIRNWLGGLIDSIRQFITQHPDFLVALGAIAVAVGALTLAFSVVSGAVGILSAALAFLFSPIVLVTVALVALVAAVAAGYPGGISGMLSDAARSAQMLAVILTGFLAVAADWARQRLVELLNTLLRIIQTIDDFKSRLETGVQGIGGIIGGVTSGQFSIGDVIKAVGAEIGVKDSGGMAAANTPYLIGTGAQPELFVPQSAGTFIPNAGKMDGIQIENVNIQANSYEQGQRAADGFSQRLDEIYKSRGN